MMEFSAIRAASDILLSNRYQNNNLLDFLFSSLLNRLSVITGGSAQANPAWHIITANVCAHVVVGGEGVTELWSLDGSVLSKEGLKGHFNEWSLGNAVPLAVTAEGGICCVSDVDSELLINMATIVSIWLTAISSFVEIFIFLVSS